MEPVEQGRTDEERTGIDELARAWRNSEAQSLRPLVEALTRPLIALAYRYTLDWEIARDLCQETWLKVCRARRRYDARRPFRPWLYAIHRNTCLSWLRRAERRRELAVESETLEAQMWQQEPADPLAALRAREFGLQLRRGLAKLSRRQREVFALVDMEQVGQEQAARTLGIRHGTLRATLHGARRRLAEFLRDLEDAS